MEVYLQPFFTKCLIDEASSDRRKLGEKIDFSQSVYFHVRFSVLAGAGVSQSVAYLALWAFSSLATLFTVGTIKSLDRFADEAGSLSVAALIGSGIAACGAVYIPAAEQLSAKLASRVDRQFHECLEQFAQHSAAEVEKVRSRRKRLGATRDNGPHPEAYFDPGVSEIRKERKALLHRLRRRYPSDSNKKFAVYAEAKRRLRGMREKQTQRLAELPVSRKEIDKYLVEEAAILASNAVNEINHYSLQVWSSRVRSWGHKFDREGFSRNCLKLIKKKKVNKHFKRMVQDVEDAERKGSAFKEFERELHSFVKDIKNKVAAIDRPWPWTRVWRYTYPWICSWRMAQAWDQLFDPDLVN